MQQETNKQLDFQVFVPQGTMLNSQGLKTKRHVLQLPTVCFLYPLLSSPPALAATVDRTQKCLCIVSARSSAAFLFSHNGIYFSQSI